MSGNVFTAQSMAKTKLALQKAGLTVEVASSTAEHAAAELVATEMEARAPVDTGRLRASIHAEGSQAMATVPYAIYQDPFAGPAARAAEPKVEAAMIAVFRTALGGR